MPCTEECKVLLYQNDSFYDVISSINSVRTVNLIKWLESSNLFKMETCHQNEGKIS